MHDLVSRLRAFLVTIVVLALVAPALRAQGEADAELFLRRDKNDVRAAIRIAITPGWHLYHEDLGPPDAVGKPTTLKFTGDGIEWSAARFPEPKRLEQRGLGAKGGDTWIWGHEGTIVLYARGTAVSDAKLEDVELSLKGLTCEDEGSCIPYSQTLTSSGAGDDALFAAFPAELAAPAAKQAQPSAEIGAGAPRKFEVPLGGKAKQHASATLYVRQSDTDVRVAIEVRVDPSYHLYHSELGPPDAVGKPTVVELSGDGFAWSETRFPEPKELPQPKIGDGGRDTWIWGHDGRIVLYARGRAEALAKLESVVAKIRGLTCTDGGECVNYAEELANSGAGDDALFAAFPADLAVDAAHGATRATTTAPGGGATDEAAWTAVTYRDYAPRSMNGAGEGADGAQRGLALWLVFAFIAGALLNVMPCVLPVVSIKVLSFVQQAGESRSRVFTLGLAFAAGILVVFLALASFAAFFGKGWGAQFQSEAFKISLIAVVFGFALSLFDVYELGVPAKVGELAAVKREGLGDAFFKGMMATVLATPCSGPFLGSTLAWALAQPTLVIFAVFMAVGLGMAAPYAVLTSNPALLRFVPRPGAWMKSFKHLMGFLLMATVIFLMISVRQDLLLFTVTLLVFVGLGCWWWGNFATFEQTSVKKLGTFVVAAGIVAIGAWFSFGTMRGWFIAPSHAWEDFDPVALERYHAEGRNVFVDFTAEWCLTCKTNEKFVYDSEEIRGLFGDKGFAIVRADETGDSPRTEAIRRLREQLGAKSIPFMAIFPGDDPSHPMTLKDLVTRGDLRQLIDACPKPVAK